VQAAVASTREEFGRGARCPIRRLFLPARRRKPATRGGRHRGTAGAVWLALRLDGQRIPLKGSRRRRSRPLCSARSAGRKPALERDLALDHLERCSVEIANALRRVVVGEDDAAGALVDIRKDLRVLYLYTSGDGRSAPGTSFGGTRNCFSARTPETRRPSANASTPTIPRGASSRPTHIRDGRQCTTRPGLPFTLGTGGCPIRRRCRWAPGHPAQSSGN